MAQDRWTEAEINTLRNMRAAGFDRRAIAERLGRTSASIKGRVQVEGILAGRPQARKRIWPDYEPTGFDVRAVLDGPGDRVEPTPEQYEDRNARLAAPFRGFTGAFFNDPRVGYSELDRKRA